MAWFIFRFSWGAAVVVLAWPRSLQACAVCFSAQARSLEAYYWTTAFLVLMPFLASAVLLGWLWYRRRKQTPPEPIEIP